MNVRLVPDTSTAPGACAGLSLPQPLVGIPLSLGLVVLVEGDAPPVDRDEPPMDDAPPVLATTPPVASEGRPPTELEPPAALPLDRVDAPPRALDLLSAPPTELSGSVLVVLGELPLPSLLRLSTPPAFGDALVRALDPPPAPESAVVAAWSLVAPPRVAASVC